MDINKEQIIKAIRIMEAAKIEQRREYQDNNQVKACDKIQSEFEKMLREKLGKPKDKSTFKDIQKLSGTTNGKW